MDELFGMLTPFGLRCFSKGMPRRTPVRTPTGNLRAGSAGVHQVIEGRNPIPTGYRVAYKQTSGEHVVALIYLSQTS